jgi:aspartate racemase
MKTLGLIGGLSWYSTSVYYKRINEVIKDRLGNSHSAKLILYSVDFNEFKLLQQNSDWDQIANNLTQIAMILENAGADCIILASNTPHLVANIIEKVLKVPLIHIVDVCAAEIKKVNVSKVGLLGTKFTMENNFFTGHLNQKGIAVLIPDEEDRSLIHSTIFDELTQGIFRQETKTKYLNIISNMINDGAEGIIFGCTEISLLLRPSDCTFIVFDTTEIHSKSAVDFALSTL